MKDLIKLAQRGDWDALCIVVEKMRDRVERMAEYYAFRCHEDAKDLIQEGWLGALEALRKVDVSIGDPQQFLIKRAKWRMLDFAKWNNRRRHESLDEVAIEEYPFVPQPSFVSVDINIFIKQLSDKQRTLVYLLLAGNTWREAAAKLGCTSANVAYHVRQIRGAYLQWLKESSLANDGIRSI